MSGEYECDNDNHAIGCQCPGREVKIPVMTRRGIIQCGMTTEGYVSLPKWVESADADHGPHMTKFDVQQVVRDQLKDHIVVLDEKPKGEKPNVVHDVDLVVTDMSGTKPIIKCQGGPSGWQSEVLAKSERMLLEARRGEDRLASKLLAAEAKLRERDDELNRWRSLESSRRNSILRQGLLPDRSSQEGKIPHMGA